MLKKLLKNLANFISLKYEIYHIFKRKDGGTQLSNPLYDVQFFEISQNSLAKYKSPLITKYLSNFGIGSYCYACTKDNEIIGICFYWFGKRYKERNFISLLSNEIKLIQVEVLESARGLGVAPHLINFSSKEVAKRSFETQYARIWHSNKASISCFKKSGWYCYKTVLTFRIGGLNFKFHLPRL